MWRGSGLVVVLALTARAAAQHVYAAPSADPPIQVLEDEPRDRGGAYLRLGFGVGPTPAGSWLVPRLGPTMALGYRRNFGRLQLDFSALIGREALVAAIAAAAPAG